MIYAFATALLTVAYLAFKVEQAKRDLEQAFDWQRREREGTARLHLTERRELISRIQDPTIAPSLAAPEPEPQLPVLDDEEMARWELEQLGIPEAD